MAHRQAPIERTRVVEPAAEEASEAPRAPAPELDEADAPLAAILKRRQADRERMVERDLKPSGIRDPAVLRAMRAVPREEFVPDELRPHAYADGPLPIGYEVTISQPAVVARMTELLQVDPGDRVLEVGTGSGYQAAVLDALGVEVFSIEIIEPLVEPAKERLARLGFDRVTVKHGDGYQGWEEHAPYDGIIVTAAPPSIPDPLRQQLKVGARLVLPVGRDWQDLVVVTRTRTGFREDKVIPVRFVPMTGEAQKH